jgi:GTP pyrophosphokinase
MDKLISACQAKFTEPEMELLKKAVDFAQKVHRNQLRESGEPYYMHPEAVALMLLEMGMDSHTVIAGLLHDVVEDGEDVTIEGVTAMFGADIGGMVDGVTKLTKTGNQQIAAKEDQQAENLRKMMLAIANDVRVVIIKLTDRLHNMRTLGYCNGDKRIRKAKETLEVYASLAHRFGMGAMKCELEDLSFQYIWPDEFERLKAAIEPHQRERMQTLNSAIQVISEHLKDAGLQA